MAYEPYNWVDNVSAADAENLNHIEQGIKGLDDVSHSHDNKSYLDKLGEDKSGNPTYNGEPISKGDGWEDAGSGLVEKTNVAEVSGTSGGEGDFSFSAGLHGFSQEFYDVDTGDRYHVEATHNDVILKKNGVIIASLVGKQNKIEGLAFSIEEFRGKKYVVINPDSNIESVKFAEHKYEFIGASSLRSGGFVAIDPIDGRATVISGSNVMLLDEYGSPTDSLTGKANASEVLKNSSTTFADLPRVTRNAHGAASAIAFSNSDGEMGYLGFYNEYGRNLPLMKMGDEEYSLASTKEITELFNPSKSYNVGDYFIYNNSLYRVTVAGAGAFSPSRCVETNVSLELKSITPYMQKTYVPDTSLESWGSLYAKEIEIATNVDLTEYSNIQVTFDTTPGVSALCSLISVNSNNIHVHLIRATNFKLTGYVNILAYR